MRYVKIAILAMAALLLAVDADAQVSVRRTRSSANTEKSASKKTDKKSDKKKDKKAGSTQTPVSAPKTQGKNVIQNTETAAPVKKSAGNKKTAQQLPSGKTLRQQAFDDYQKEVVEETPWQHIVYRELDLTKDENASLYFPVEPMDGLTNLFRVIFDAFCKGEVTAYEYLDGREVFTDEFKVKPLDLFQKYESIDYKVIPAQGRDGKETYEVSESSVPSSLVLSYLIKERWEFDQKHSRYHARILCISPVLHESGEVGAQAIKTPLFWLKYEDIRPFLRDHLVVSSGMNTAARYTMEEFFSLGQYKGDIYKEQNLRGLSLQQQVGDNPDTLRMVQEKLDNDLRTFRDSIWVKDPLPEEKPAKRVSSREKREVTRLESDSKNSETVEMAPKKNRRTKQQVDMEAVAEEREAKATARKSVRR